MKLARSQTKDGMRLYEAAGASVPSVTTVISGIESDAWLHAWKNRVGEATADEVRENAARLGNRVHALIDGADVEAVTEYERKIADGALRWLDKHVDEVLASELRMVGLEGGGFGGTVDKIVRMKTGGLAVVDWKTSKKLGPTHNLQAAGYTLLGNAAIRNGLIPGIDGRDEITERYVVRLWKDTPNAGRVSTRVCKNYADYAAFIAAVVIWHWRHPGKAKVAN